MTELGRDGLSACTNAVIAVLGIMGSELVDGQERFV